MKLGFTGSQSGMNQFQKNEFTKLLDQFKPDELHHGDCIGSDAQAHELFINWHLKNREHGEKRVIVIHPPSNFQKSAMLWQKWQPKDNGLIKSLRVPLAYLERNKEIVNETELLIATPKELEHTLRSGTWTTIRYGWHCKKQVIVVPPIGIGK